MLIHSMESIATSEQHVQVQIKLEVIINFVFVLGKNVIHPFSKNTLPTVSESLWVNLTSSCLDGNWIWGGAWYWTR